MFIAARLMNYFIEWYYLKKIVDYLKYTVKHKKVIIKIGCCKHKKVYDLL